MFEKCGQGREGGRGEKGGLVPSPPSNRSLSVFFFGWSLFASSAPGLFQCSILYCLVFFFFVTAFHITILALTNRRKSGPFGDNVFKNPARYK